MGLAAAVGIAEVAFSATAILQSVAIVGAVVSVVGTVTKNPVLSKIGMGLGLVGGLGALATSALGLSTDALFGASSAAGEAAGGAAGAAEGAVSSAVAGEGGWSVAAPDVISSLDATTAAAAAPTEAFAANPLDTLGAAPGETPTGLINTSTTAAEDAGTTAAAAPTAEDAAATLKEGIPRAPLDLGSTSTVTGQPITSAVDPITGLTTGIPGGADSSGGLMSTLMSYVDKHPTIAFGALQGASSLLSGWTSTLTPAQVAALNAQAASNQAAANLTTQQTANLAMPKAVASSAPVTGAPQPLVPALQQQPGFINQAPSPSMVTGRAA